MNIKPIDEFPDYAVSDEGKVFRLTEKRNGISREYHNPRELKQNIVSGYLVVCLSTNNKKTYRLVHRLVLLTHGGRPPSEKHQAAHLDGDRTNNKLNNLIWATRTENELHKRDHGTSCNGERNTQAKLSTAEVVEIRKSAAEGGKRKDLAKEFGVSVSNINMIVNFQSRRIA